MMLYKVKGFIPKDGRYGGGYEGMIVSASDGIGPLPYVWGTTVVALPKNGIPIGRQMTNVGIYLDPWYGSTLEEAHRALWLWLAENGTKNKAGWPGWEQNGGPWPMPKQKCFACIDAFDKENHCPKCPLDWGQHCPSTVPCEMSGALYRRWMRANEDDRSTLARQIANMPWHDRTKKEEQTMPEQVIDYYSLPLITDFSGLEGAKVWHPELGIGKVTVINCADGRQFPVGVQFETFGLDTFTLGGSRLLAAPPLCRLISKPAREHTKEGWIFIDSMGKPHFFPKETSAQYAAKQINYRGPLPAKLTWEE